MKNRNKNQCRKQLTLRIVIIDSKQGYMIRLTINLVKHHKGRKKMRKR